MTTAAHPLSTCVPGQARPRTQRNARGTNVRARAGIFTSPLGVKTPDLRALLRTAQRPGDCVVLSRPFHVIFLERGVSFDESVGDCKEFACDGDERDFCGFSLSSHIGVDRLEARV